VTVKFPEIYSFRLSTFSHRQLLRNILDRTVRVEKVI